MCVKIDTRFLEDVLSLFWTYLYLANNLLLSALLIVWIFTRNLGHAFSILPFLHVLVKYLSYQSLSVCLQVTGVFSLSGVQSAAVQCLQKVLYFLLPHQIYETLSPCPRNFSFLPSRNEASVRSSVSAAKVRIYAFICCSVNAFNFAKIVWVEPKRLLQKDTHEFRCSLYQAVILGKWSI